MPEELPPRPPVAEPAAPSEPPVASAVSDPAPRADDALAVDGVPLAELLAGEDVPWPLVSAASLSSLVLHASVLVVLASLTFPPRPRNVVGELTASISMTAHVDEENVGDLVNVELEPQPDDGESLNDSGDDAADDLGTEQVKPESTEPETTPEVSLDEPAPLELPEPAAPSVDVAADDPAAEKANVAVAQNTNSLAGALSQSQEDPEFDSWLAQHVRADSPGDEGVVDRFILYDVGRLNGEAGERARREFNQLGPQHVPALVKGLNKAASIKASCPVLVISYKLATALGKIEDPEMLQYATENIGRGVPEDAPHWGRIRQMQRLSAQLQGKLQPQQPAPANE